VIGNSLDFEAQSAVWAEFSEAGRKQVRRELFGEDGVPVVAWVGRLVANKELSLLLEAVALLSGRGQRVNVVMVGDGPERASLASLAERLGVRVHFEGACYDERRIGALVSSANATVSPGPIGLTTLHSLAFGTPVVSHGDPEGQMPEHEAIVPGKTGSLFERGSAESLAEQLEFWCGPQASRDETGRTCRELVRRLWSPGYQVEALVRAVEGLPADEVSLAWMRSAGPGIRPVSA
jgi:1,2-diacylglycerol 3-alpha-glucosyltransferase